MIIFNDIFKTLDKVLKFVKEYSTPVFKRTNEAKDIKLIANSFADYTSQRTKKEYLLIERTKGFLVLNVIFLVFSLLLAATTYWVFEFLGNWISFVETHREQLKLLMTIFFSSLSVIALSFALFMFARLRLISRVITINRIDIILEILKTWKMDNVIIFLRKENGKYLFKINELIAYIDEDPKNKKISIQSKKVYKNTLLITGDDIKINFIETFKNSQIADILNNDAIQDTFESIKLKFNLLDLENQNMSEIILNKKANVENLIVTLFIIFIFDVYSTKGTITQNNKKG